MATQKQSPNYLPKTKANNTLIISLVEKDKGPVGQGHHNAHRTAAIMKWLDSKESKKSGNGDGSQPPPDNPNVDSNPNDWKPKKSKGYGVDPKGTPDKNLGTDKQDSFSDAPDKMPVIGRKKKNASDGLTPNIHLPAPRALSPEETKYYEYLKQHLKDPGGIDKLNNFLDTVHDSNA